MLDPARDNFETYYTEKLWELIPSIYRHEDGLGDHPGVLRALVETVASQAALLRRSQDRLWDDPFIELCDDWAIPYLSDLLGTRLVSVLNRRGRRVDVAKTIYYRRRKGTLRVLEELISDMSGWEGTAVESFRRLGRARHGLDPRPGLLAGPVSGTLPGGWADLRRPQGTRLLNGPFDEFHHLADVRRGRGLDGRYNIPKLAFHLYRLRAFRVEGATPWAVPGTGGLGFTADPSGRDTPLFRPRLRARDWDDWRPAREWDLPGAIACRLLNQAEYQVDEALVQRLVSQHNLPAPAAADLRTLNGFRFTSEARLRATLESLPNQADLLAPAAYAALLAGGLTPDSAKFHLLPGALEVEDAPGLVVPPESIVAAGLAGWNANAPGKRLAVDPELGRLLFLNGGGPAAGSTITYHSGFSGPFGAGTYDRREVESRPPTQPALTGGGGISAANLDAGSPAGPGVTQIGDSATYGPVANKLSVQHMVVQAANRQRPYLRLQADWVLNTGAHQDARLVLDGLWLGSGGPLALVLRGNYEEVILRSCTLDPGGQDAAGGSLGPVGLVIEGQVETLRIERSILGPVGLGGGGAVERACLQDSIVQATLAGQAALVLPDAPVELQRVTVFGAVDVERLWAEDSLITGLVDVTDTQTGCFRFSAAPAGSRLPHPYQAHTLEDAGHIFTSRSFGQPGYAQLSQTAPPALLTGAENGAEMGAFNSLMGAIKLAGLQAKVEEFMPFGLVPVFVFED